MIYFDQAATSFPKPPEVLAAVQHAMETCASIGRSGHKLSMAASEIAFEARKTAGKMFDASPEQVVFTFNATHGLNIAIRSVVSPGDKVLISGFEHNAVVRPLHHLGAEMIVCGTKLFDPEDTLQAFEQGLQSGAAAVICTHVSNVFGYILPVEKIAALCRDYNVPFVLDASQSAGVLPVSMKRLDAAFIAMPGHKSLFGPQGTGLLLCGKMPKPLLYGGTGSTSRDPSMPDFLPDLLEPGTHNLPGIAGLLAGLQFVDSTGPSSIITHELRLRQLFQKVCSQLPNISGYFDTSGNQSGVISWNVKGTDCETVASALSERGVAVRAGLHCAPLAHQSAGTLDSGTVRISFSVNNTEDEILSFGAVISDLLEGGFSYGMHLPILRF